jgi:Fe-S-cluster containining protein
MLTGWTPSARVFIYLRSLQQVMASIGNKSKLAYSEICQSCGKCCTNFSWTDTADQALRIGWMQDKDIEIEDTPFRFPDGEDIKIITLNKGCKMLEIRNGKYFCKAYNKVRPDFCNTYPDIIFLGVSRRNRKQIQRLIDFEKHQCPIFEILTVDEVINKLYSRTPRTKPKISHKPKE